MNFNIIFVFLKKVILFIPLSILQLFDNIKNKKNNVIPLQDRYGLYGFIGLAR